ncbi:hypothetical protein FISHEDRAFT_71893 [Fistulina hepatica ATCC 64428]|uniref:Uncharacterized protein n=1 Tax=Fistulina hepatica ATCC 64428 TaxID=1128425 RepID=A0A0D7AIY6_9AGAR|nr:hypothetical protein FISHEDRAFT_71893 [Fistulina hepatica ATCC 64428]
MSPQQSDSRTSSPPTTPRPRDNDPPPQYPANDTLSQINVASVNDHFQRPFMIKEMLQMRSYTSCVNFHKESITKELTDLQHSLAEHKNDIEKKHEQLRLVLREKGGEREGAMKRVLDNIQVLIKETVANSVKKEVDANIKEWIRVPVETRRAQLEKQIGRMDIALTNSNARRRNAQLQPGDLDEPIGPIFRDNGTKSSLFPADLRSLYSYPPGDLKTLLGDYDISLDPKPNFESVINKFLTFVGESRSPTFTNVLQLAPGIEFEINAV